MDGRAMIANEVEFVEDDIKRALSPARCETAFNVSPRI